MFAARTGGPLSHRNVQRRGFERARDLGELDESLTFPRLRHAFASYAAHRGVPVNILSEVMGHTDVGVTQRVYIHLYGRAQAEQSFREAMAGSAYLVKLSPSQEERFRSKIGQASTERCLPWLGAINANGYGQWSYTENPRGPSQRRSSASTSGSTPIT